MRACSLYTCLRGIICISDSSLVCFPRRMQVDRKHRRSAAWALQRSRARSSTTPSICDRVSVVVSISHPVNRGVSSSSHPRHRARADRLCTAAPQSPSTAQVAAFSGWSFSGQRASALTGTSSAVHSVPSHHPTESKQPAYAPVIAHVQAAAPQLLLCAPSGRLEAETVTM